MHRYRHVIVVVMTLAQRCQTRGLLGPHCIYEQSYRGPHEVLDLEITTSLGNDLCNVAGSKIDLQKKKYGHHLSSISKVISE